VGGYVGASPADTTRSVLLAALAEAAVCETCRGTGHTAACNVAAANRAPAMPCANCNRGYRRVPHRQFTTEHVAHSGDQWRISRGQILAWLANYRMG